MLPLLAAAGAGVARAAPYIAAALPFIQDLFSGGGAPDPEKVAALGKLRDDLVERRVAAEGISRERALAEVNDQLKPLIESGGEDDGGGVSGMIGDVAGAIGAGAIGAKLGRGLARKAAVGKRRASMDRRPAPRAEPEPVPERAEPAPELDQDTVSQLVAARLRELSDPLPAGGGMDLVNSAMGTGRGTKGFKRAAK